MPDATDHRATVRDEFTKQAAAYAANAAISDRDRIDRLIRVVDPASEARVLEVATGPGYVALGFADACDLAVGVDLTAEPLSIAEETRAERGLPNAHFLQGDAEFLPVPDGAFDVVVCRFAFHHVEAPERVLEEMVRACAPDGTVVVEDLVTSEHPARAAYQNDFERLRDPSHVRALPLGELLGLFAGAGLEVEATHTDTMLQEVEDWLANAETPPERAERARSMIEEDAEADVSGARPFWRDGALCFRHRTALVAGRPVPVEDGR